MLVDQLDTQQIIVLNKLTELQRRLEAKTTLFNNISKIFKPDPHKLMGMYIYGGVGCGKTTLMNMFFANLNIADKIILHFHEFMQQIHKLLYEGRNVEMKGDPIIYAARKFSTRCKLLCLDEFFIDNIADAMIVGRLFEQLFALNIHIVITSNLHPDQLYYEGLQRENFLKFVHLIKDKLEIYHLNSSQDYRQLYLSNHDALLYPSNKENNQRLRDLFYKLTVNHSIKSITINVQGRSFVFKHTSESVIMVEFDQLCSDYLWIPEYIALINQFKVVILLNIPRFDDANRNELKRFVTLIDLLYENNVILFASMADSIYNLADPKLDFVRTASRLIEMKSIEYTNKGVE